MGFRLQVVIASSSSLGARGIACMALYHTHWWHWGQPPKRLQQSEGMADALARSEKASRKSSHTATTAARTRRASSPVQGSTPVLILLSNILSYPDNNLLVAAMYDPFNTYEAPDHAGAIVVGTIRRRYCC